MRLVGSQAHEVFGRGPQEALITFIFCDGAAFFYCYCYLFAWAYGVLTGGCLWFRNPHCRCLSVDLSLSHRPRILMNKQTPLTDSRITTRTKRRNNPFDFGTNSTTSFNGSTNYYHLPTICTHPRSKHHPTWRRPPLPIPSVYEPRLDRP